MIASDAATTTRSTTDGLQARTTPQRQPHSFGQQSFGQRGGQQQSSQQQPNVGPNERLVSAAAGAILALAGLGRRTIPGLLTAGVGAAMLYRASTGHCPAYAALGLDTAHTDEQDEDDDVATNGVHIATAFLINKPAEELYNYWRNFENLPNIMHHLKSVTMQDGGQRSHWVVKAPKLLGGQVEWDAEITADEPNSRIAWRSVAGSQIDTAGEITFQKALGDRGTDVHVSMYYRPPAGKLGHFLAAMLGENPKRVVREDLRNFKRIMEIGEILTIIGQSHGTCTGRGAEYTENDWRPEFT